MNKSIRIRRRAMPAMPPTIPPMTAGAEVFRLVPGPDPAPDVGVLLAPVDVAVPPPPQLPPEDAVELENPVSVELIVEASVEEVT
jgi:hypothetical protein